MSDFMMDALKGGVGDGSQSFDWEKALKTGVSGATNGVAFPSQQSQNNDALTQFGMSAGSAQSSSSGGLMKLLGSLL